MATTPTTTITTNIANIATTTTETTAQTTTTITPTATTIQTTTTMQTATTIPNQQFSTSLSAILFVSLPSYEEFISQHLESLPNVEHHDCSICFNDETDPEFVKTPCGHVFGRECLVTWLGGSLDLDPHDTCPMCREVLYELLRQEDYSDIESMLGEESDLESTWGGDSWDEFSEVSGYQGEPASHTTRILRSDPGRNANSGLEIPLTQRIEWGSFQTSIELMVEEIHCGMSIYRGSIAEFRQQNQHVSEERLRQFADYLWTSVRYCTKSFSPNDLGDRFLYWIPVRITTNMIKKDDRHNMIVMLQDLVDHFREQALSDLSQADTEGYIKAMVRPTGEALWAIMVLGLEEDVELSHV